MTIDPMLFAVIVTALVTTAVCVFYARRWHYTSLGRTLYWIANTPEGRRHLFDDLMTEETYAEFIRDDDADEATPAAA